MVARAEYVVDDVLPVGEVQAAGGGPSWVRSGRRGPRPKRAYRLSESARVQARDAARLLELLQDLPGLRRARGVRCAACGGPCALGEPEPKFDGRQVYHCLACGASEFTEVVL